MDVFPRDLPEETQELEITMRIPIKQGSKPCTPWGRNLADHRLLYGVAGEP